jgi:hypothetical protein
MLAVGDVILVHPLIPPDGAVHLLREVLQEATFAFVFAFSE